MKTRVDPKLAGALISALFAGVVVVIALFSMNTYSDKAGARETEKIADIITRAAIQCYALEGGYPPSLEYLEEKYNILLNRDSFVYFYSTDGMDNILPDIVVQPIIRR